MFGSGVKKKVNVLPSGVIKGESSAPAVLIRPGTGTGFSHSSEWSWGGERSSSGNILTAYAGRASSLALAGIPFSSGVGVSVQETVNTIRKIKQQKAPLKIFQGETGRIFVDMK